MVNADRYSSEIHRMLYNLLGCKKIHNLFPKMWVSEPNAMYKFKAWSDFHGFYGGFLNCDIKSLD